MPEIVHKTSDVFGLSRDLPLNYVQRDKVDKVFVENLTREKHVVVYGSSKQGKTSLRKSWLKSDEHVVVSCVNTMSLEELHGAILKSAGYRVEQTAAKSVSGTYKYQAEFKGEGKIPFIGGVEAKGQGAYERARSDTTTTRPLELDLGDVNDIILALTQIEFNKYVILEDFHYLPIETQKNFSFALKTFHENSKICFIIIGVWREKNRLNYYNGDLKGRVVSIDADEWSGEELKQVIDLGEKLLNITFDEHFIKQIIESCYDAVYLIQEACFKACEAAKFYRTSDDNIIIGSGVDGKLLIKEVVDESAGAYTGFLTNFAEGFQKTELDMYKWLLYAVIASEEAALERGLRRAEISALVKKYHPLGAKLNEGNITQALQNAASLQTAKSIRPIIIDYDQTTKILNVVDRGFIIWLAYQNKSEILEEIAGG